MKRYHYHVAYYLGDKSGGMLEDTIIHTPTPIKTEEDFNTVRGAIRTRYGGRGFVVILNITLLRIEDAKPEEVATL